MCRWLAYTGEALQPSTLILDAQHSVVAMSLNSPLGAETVNGDGFGFGWYPADAADSAHPAVFRRIESAWNDPSPTRPRPPPPARARRHQPPHHPRPRP